MVELCLLVLMMLVKSAGEIIGLDNSSESIVRSYDYDVFGEIKSETGSLISPYFFTGREYDSESELYYYRARYYEADVGRFNTKDNYRGDIYLPQSLNKYAYVGNNPVNYVDPTGYTSWLGVLEAVGRARLDFVPVGSTLSGLAADVGTVLCGGHASSGLGMLGEYSGRSLGGEDIWWGDVSEAAGRAVLDLVPGGSTLADIAADVGTWAGSLGGGTQGDDNGQGGGGDETLPVTLSSFTAEFDNGATTLAWATQSETNNLGWNIYRGKNDDNFVNAAQINNEIITGYGTTSQPHDYIYEDEIEDEIPGDVYWYWLESIDLGGEIHHYNMVAKLVIPDDYEPEIPPELPVIYGLYQNSPNPFSAKTRICFNLHKSSFVEINIYNIRGEFVKCIYNDLAEFDENKPKPKVTYWDGKNENARLQSTGIYLYELKVDGKVFSTKRLILMR